MKYPNPTHSHACCPICATRCVIPIERKGQLTYCRRHRASRDNPSIPRTEFAGSTAEIGVYKIYRDPDESWSPSTELSRGELERMAKIGQIHPDSRWIHGDTVYGFYKRVLIPVERITA
jgi:hypothetical protein